MLDDFAELKKQLEVLNAISVPWFVCGGWAIDLFLNRKTREHGDVEVCIFRESQLDLQEKLGGFNFYFLQNGKKYPWLKNQFFELPIHEIWAEKGNQKIEILLDETEGVNWVYRRNSLITLPVTKLECVSETGLKFLAPEVVLLYKSKDARDKDNQDFNVVFPFLSNEQKKWLKESLEIIDTEHPWILKI